mmetsp:Transcript_85200/g.182605  ORF Transcript_85200/g.182605 Transcript_85200/m.182605 type:complete len:143 (-) Transcript_85200:109-537(-)
MSSPAKKVAGTQAAEATDGNVPIQVTPLAVLYNFFSSPGGFFMLVGIPAWLGMGSTYQSHETLLILGAVGFGMVGSSFLVSKMENSEWRRNLRQQAAQKEREMMKTTGITHADLVTAAGNMGLPPPPEDLKTPEAADIKKTK